MKEKKKKILSLKNILAKYTKYHANLFENRSAFSSALIKRQDGIKYARIQARDNKLGQLGRITGFRYL